LKRTISRCRAFVDKIWFYNEGSRRRQDQLGQEQGRKDAFWLRFLLLLIATNALTAADSPSPTLEQPREVRLLLSPLARFSYRLLTSLSPLILKSPRSPSVDTGEYAAGAEESSELRALDQFASAVEKLTESSVVLSHKGCAEATGDFFRGLQEMPVSEGDVAQKTLLMQMASLLLKSETRRSEALLALNSEFGIPMKQFLRVDVAGVHDLKDRVDNARASLEEAQLRYDIARSSNKKKAVVEKLSQELEHAKRQHGLLKMNLVSKLKEFDSRQRFDCLQRLLRSLAGYSAMFEELQREYAGMAERVKETIGGLEKRKDAWEVERSQVNVGEIMAAEMEIEISRQGYVDVGQAALGVSMGRLKKMWMVASQGMLYLYQTWKDEAPKSQVDLKLCSVRPDGEAGDGFQLTCPNEVFQVKCQTAEEAEAWMDVIRKSIQYKLKQLQEEKRRNDPNSVPDYLKEMQMLSPDNKLCADCAARNPEWASMTLGVIVCDDCSGVHRQLGTHISRVRSLTIDMWNPEQYYVFKQYGNSFANPLWEHRLQQDKVNKRLGGKPTATSTREERDLFIRTKYIDKRWLQAVPEAWKTKSSSSGLELAEKLYDFGSRNDLKSMYLALAHGANPAAQLESGMSVFHQLVSDGSADVYSLQKLMLHSNELNKKSISGFDALHVAAHHNRAVYCKFLMGQGFDINSKSNSGLTARELAVDAKAADVLKLLDTGVLPVKEEQPIDELQKRALDMIARISRRLAEHRDVLKDSTDSEEENAESIFEIAKQIRMVKIGLQQMEKEGMLT
jgi:Arf-GAP/coiled-coil/ANK repeat/PH domain-containing protein